MSTMYQDRPHQALGADREGPEAQPGARPDSPETISPSQIFTSVGPLPAVAPSTTSERAPTASELSYGEQQPSRRSVAPVSESDVPRTPSGFARFAVQAGLAHDGLRSIARALGVGVDCGRSRGVEIIALRLFMAATQAGVVAELPALVVRELTSGAVSSADTLLHPRQMATLDEVPAALLPLRAWCAERLSEEEIQVAATLAGLGLEANQSGSTELRAQHLIIQANRSQGSVEQLRRALVEVYNRKVRQADSG